LEVAVARIEQLFVGDGPRSTVQADGCEDSEIGQTRDEADDIAPSVGVEEGPDVGIGEDVLHLGWSEAIDDVNNREAPEGARHAHLN
jgi:hypothetical protein